MFSERPQPDTPLIAAFPEPETLLRIRARPGSRFSYSNMGYTLLGMIVEAVTGERYETYLDRQLLAPLGMHDSTFAFTTQEGESADPALAWGHVDDGTRYAARAVFLRPAAQFTTAAGDLARYLQFLLGDGLIDGRTFIQVPDGFAARFGCCLCLAIVRSTGNRRLAASKTLVLRLQEPFDARHAQRSSRV